VVTVILESRHIVVQIYEQSGMRHAKEYTK
jgi:hypothetical protein